MRKSDLEVRRNNDEIWIVDKSTGNYIQQFYGLSIDKYSNEELINYTFEKHKLLGLYSMEKE